MRRGDRSASGDWVEKSSRKTPSPFGPQLQGCTSNNVQWREPLVPTELKGAALPQDAQQIAHALDRAAVRVSSGEREGKGSKANLRNGLPFAMAHRDARIAHPAKKRLALSGPVNAPWGIFSSCSRLLPYVCSRAAML